MKRGIYLGTIPSCIGGPLLAVLFLDLPILVSAWVVSLNSGPLSFRTRTRLNLFRNNYENDKDSTAAAPSSGGITLDTALAVIPPDEAWDRLQRARHVARDRSYAIWPPAIRLFHPFVDSPQLHDTALRVAEIVDRYDVRPFEVTLSQWSIVPHQEALEVYFRSLRQLPEQHSSSIGGGDDPKDTEVSEEEQNVLDLIADEERIGRERFKKRQKRERRLQKERGVQLNDGETTKKKSVKQRSEQPPAEQHEFNGPCVICLEPDEASQEHLQALRYLLKCELGPEAADYAYLFSPSGSLPLTATATGAAASSNDNNNSITQQQHRQPLSIRKRKFLRRDRKDDDDDDDDDPTLFRPLVPIAAFPTVSSAIPVARKLRKLWEPLTFNVTDLQLLSCRSDAAELDVLSPSKSQHNDAQQVDGLLQEYYGRFQQILHQDSSHRTMSTREEELLQITSEFSNSGRSSRQFGCDALVSLVGEEIEMDNELNEKIARWVWEHGAPGGHVSNQENRDDNQRKLPATRDLSGLKINDGEEVGEEEEGMRSDLEQWLLQDEEEFDEGTVVVIGRTHFFTGEMRTYVGMPASSALDAQDRSVDTAVARRKGSTAMRFDDGDYGTRKKKTSAK